MGTMIAGMTTPIDGPFVVALAAADSESEVVVVREAGELAEFSVAFGVAGV